MFLLLPFLLTGQTISSNAIMDFNTAELSAPCNVCTPWRYSRQDSTLRRWDYTQLRWERIATEDQILSISNDTLFLTNGGFVLLPSALDLIGIRDTLEEVYDIIMNGDTNTANVLRVFLPTSILTTYGADPKAPRDSIIGEIAKAYQLAGQVRPGSILVSQVPATTTNPSHQATTLESSTPFNAWFWDGLRVTRISYGKIAVNLEDTLAGGLNNIPIEPAPDATYASVRKFIDDNHGVLSMPNGTLLYWVGDGSVVSPDTIWVILDNVSDTTRIALLKTKSSSTVELALPTEFNVVNDPDLLSASWVAQSPNRVLAGPVSGPASTPSFRLPTATDITAWGGVTGTGTSGTYPVWGGASSLANGRFANITGGVQVTGSNLLQLGSWTLDPIGVNGGLGYRSDLGVLRYYDGVAAVWRSVPTGTFSAGQILFGQTGNLFTSSGNLFYTNSSLKVLRAETSGANPWLFFKAPASTVAGSIYGMYYSQVGFTAKAGITFESASPSGGTAHIDFYTTTNFGAGSDETISSSILRRVRIAENGTLFVGGTTNLLGDGLFQVNGEINNSSFWTMSGGILRMKPNNGTARIVGGGNGNSAKFFINPFSGDHSGFAVAGIQPQVEWDDATDRNNIIMGVSGGGWVQRWGWNDVGGTSFNTIYVHALTELGLGLGITSPSQRLHVVGNARVTGAYFDSNNTSGQNGDVLGSNGTVTAWRAQRNGVFSGSTDSSGDITITFATPMPDATYSYSVTLGVDQPWILYVHSLTTTTFKVGLRDSTTGLKLGAGQSVTVSFTTIDY